MSTLRVAVKDMETAKEHAMWGTFGKQGNEPLKFVRLVDCTTEHLQAILRTQPLERLGTDYRVVIHSILADRQVKPEEYSDAAHHEYSIMRQTATKEQ